jgi:heat-inducible transcriptional repressor
MGEKVNADIKIDRHHAILMALISAHIRTAEPVGSRSLVERYRLDVSAATVRNVLADLEKDGYLSQPHTSAGRIPTEKAYRYYVDTLCGREPNGEGAETEHIRKAIRDFSGGVDDFLRWTSRLLSDLSHYAGVVLPPRRGRGLFKRITFVGINRDTVLAVLVSMSGVTTNKLVKTGENFKQERLDRMSSYLNRRFSGMSLVEMRRRIERDLDRDLENLERWMKAALKLSTGLFDEPEGREVYLEGGSHFLEMPEFLTDLDSIRAVFRAFDEKRGLVALLDETIKASELTVFIGSETGMEEMRSMSLVVSTYGRENGPLGAMGVIGPTRMDYSMVIPLVGSAAMAVSESIPGDEESNETL